MNKLAVKDLLKGFDSENNGSLETEDFFTSMSSMGMPLTEEGKAKLLTVYDKKGEGKISYSDLLSDHKYIHAVSGGVAVLVGVAGWAGSSNRWTHTNIVHAWRWIDVDGCCASGVRATT